MRHEGARRRKAAALFAEPPGNGQQEADFLYRRTVGCLRAAFIPTQNFYFHKRMVRRFGRANEQNFDSSDSIFPLAAQE